MKTMNQITLYGCVGKDPERKQTQSGKSVATFSVATSTGGYKGRDGSEIPEKTTWHNIVAWEPLTKACEYIHKGDKVLVVGRYESRQYQAADGKTMTVYEVIATDIALSPKTEQPAPKQASPLPEFPQTSPAQTSYQQTIPAADDGLPF